MVPKIYSQRILFTLIILFFLVFLIIPITFLLGRSIVADGQLSLHYYYDILNNQTIVTSLFNSIKISLLASTVTTILAFFAAYTIHMTHSASWIKTYNKTMVLLPMLVPTITYGFILMYLFGNEGILARILGEAPFTIYGKNGLFIGYVIYTLPAAYFIISNAFNYVDHRFYYISQLMKDNSLRRFYHTVLRPLLIPIANAFVLSFILSFTDFGIPASIGADYNVIATSLYQMILGSIPKFAEGSVIAVLMLIPAVVGFIFLSVIEKWNVRQQGDFHTIIKKRPIHDNIMNGANLVLSTVILLIFMVMFIVPFTERYPYQLSFTLTHVIKLFQDDILIHIYIQSLFVAIATAVFGTIISFCGALITVRTQLYGKQLLKMVSMITNTVPGMILGLSYLLFFQNSSIKGTFLIVILSIVVHYYTTPFLMAKSALDKLNPSWDTTSTLMRDTWGDTIFKIIIPNMKTTIVEMVNYYFINSMVTISGVIFLVSTSTQIVSTQINQLQHFNRFVDIFILSILIFLTNVIARLLTSWWLKSQSRKEES
ncbi:ABC transporter permease subunit [Staphylococcus equorum]|uniref:ABC transporter permease subunit n=1 Tax=Staphylococcus equorum TaxID=246432 RepID=UPI0008063403|nr:ABC transporter permease subunit [Staphylococcus equorum]ANQ63442.1 iron ABC transporter permease [Staphylococcus equorum]